MFWCIDSMRDWSLSTYPRNLIHNGSFSRDLSLSLLDIQLKCTEILFHEKVELSRIEPNRTLLKSSRTGPNRISLSTTQVEPNRIELDPRKRGANRTEPVPYSVESNRTESWFFRFVSASGSEREAVVGVTGVQGVSRTVMIRVLIT
jgi:hypothetical protein